MNMESNAFDELKWRGLVFDNTEGLPELLLKEKITVYNGFDPTSNSLQVGNLLVLMGLARLQRYGHTPIALAGGGTGLIGDPGGKSEERKLLNIEEVEANVEAIKVQLASILDFEAKSNPARVLNNADWLRQLNMMNFLRDVGKHFTVNYMMAKDSVKSRLTSEEGISYTEFSYMLLQSYDFLHLYDHHQCRVQAGGSDQWGNITAGIELIRRVRGERVYGLVYPLVTNPDGTKLGKSEKGAIYLSPEKTSPYQFYQFWYNQGDAEVISYLKIFTWLNREQIQLLQSDHEMHPEQRPAQRKLAQEMTRMVHGETALMKAEQASQVLFGGEISGLSAGELLEVFAEVPSSHLHKGNLEGEGMLLVDLMVETKVANSKGEARRLIDNGGAYLNNQRLNDASQIVGLEDAIEGKVMVLRKGKKAYHLVEII